MTPEHLCPHLALLPIPCACGATTHFCGHCHDDPPAGHTCPCCKRPAREETP